MNSARVWGQATYDMGDPTKELTKHCMQHPIQPHTPDRRSAVSLSKGLNSCLLSSSVRGLRTPGTVPIPEKFPLPKAKV